jgi:hypothetical protein
MLEYATLKRNKVKTTKTLRTLIQYIDIDIDI